MTKSLTFSSKGVNYAVSDKDIFMDNGAAVVFIQNGKYANPTATRISLPATEWQRIKPALSQVDYEEYFGRKPLMKGVSIYQVKQ